MSLVVACVKVTQQSGGSTEVKTLRNQGVAARGQHEGHKGLENCGVERLMPSPESLRSYCSCVSHPVMSDSLLLCPRNSPGKNTGVGSHSLH